MTPEKVIQTTGSSSKRGAEQIGEDGGSVEKALDSQDTDQPANAVV